MKLTKTTKPGICDASRCQLPDVEVFGDGTKLCQKHADMYKEAGATDSGLAAQGHTEPEPGPNSEAAIVAQLAPMKTEAEVYAGKLATFKITSQAKLDLAAKLLREVKGNAKTIETQRKSVTKPLLDTKKQIDTWFKPTADALAKVEGILKTAINTYTAEQQAEKVALLAAGDHTAALAMPETNLPKGVTQRTLWRWEVEDATKVPRGFLCVDANAVQAAVDKHHDSANIPGIKVFAVTSTAVKA